MFAIDDSTSIDWARLMRGTASIDSAVNGRRPSSSTIAGSNAGAKRAITVASDRTSSSCAGLGALTPSTTSAAAASPMVAPAAS